MNTKLLVLIAAVIMFTACNGDKKVKLDKMKAEYEKLGNDIKVLENEIKSNGDTTLLASNTKISFIEIKKSIFSHYIEVPGKVDGEENVIATSQAMGVVTKVYVKEGEKVSKGQILAELDAGMVTQTLNQLNTQLVFLTDLYNRQKSLWDQKIGSEVQYLSAKNNKENIENQIKTIKEQNDMYKVTSPISGTIEEAPVKIGQSLAPGMVAFRVINFNRVKIVADVSEVNSIKIKQGNEVKITFPEDNKTFDAKIDFTSKYINPINRTFQIESYVKPGEIEYRANMIAIMNILDYRNNEAFVIPANLIQTDSKSQFIWIALKSDKGYTVSKKTITIGLSYNGLTEINTGLSEGDILLTSNLFDIQENQKIEL